MNNSLLSIDGVGPLTNLVFQTAGFHQVYDLVTQENQEKAIIKAAEKLACDGKLNKEYYYEIIQRCKDIILGVRSQCTINILPEWSLCALTYIQLVDPVIAPSGYSYESSIISKRLESDPIDPMTREPLTSKQLIKNNSLKTAINHYNEKVLLYDPNAPYCVQLKPVRCI